VNLLLKKEKTNGQREIIEEDWRTERMRAIGSVQGGSFKCTILRMSWEVCGLITVEAGGKKGERWCTETAAEVRERKNSYDLWL
jgi:hypothetical protein